jgi:murein DD-endopeptidase MepM/ murein hydrolase activator NlpD
MKKSFLFFSLLVITASLIGAQTVYRSEVVAATSVDQAEIDRLKAEIETVQNELKQRKEETDKLQKESDVYAKEIEQKQREQNSLENQLQIIARQIDSAQVNNLKTQGQIRIKELEIQRLQAENEELDIQVNNQRQVLASYVRALDRNDRKSPLYGILVHKSLTDFFDQQKTIADLQESIKGLLEDLERTLQETALRQEYAAQKRDSLERLTEKLQTQKRTYEEQESVKSILLEQTEQSEEKFQQLLAQVKDEQAALSSTVQSLEQTARAKLNELTAKLPPEQQQEAMLQDSGPLSWPFGGGRCRRISAYFQDPTHPYRNLFRHSGIDMPCPAGTPVLATADGIVGVARNVGWITSGNRRYPAYNYVLLAHTDISTVYGHLSRVTVSQGQFVKRGDVIGMSGGIPGTEGAGTFTTGAHLHFEVRINGLPTNPLPYLQ